MEGGGGGGGNYIDCTIYRTYIVHIYTFYTLVDIYFTGGQEGGGAMKLFQLYQSLNTDDCWGRGV